MIGADMSPYPFSEQPVIELHLVDIKHLHSQMIELWPGFVGDAPDEWKSDGFLESNAPISVTSRFGQDQIICGAGTAAEEAENWFKERDWQHVAHMTFAIATDITFVILVLSAGLIHH